MLSPSMLPTAITPDRRSKLSNDLARRYTPRIRRHATRFARRLPRHVALQDLMSAGWVGLIDAFERFDTSRLDSFEAYVDHRIRGAILDELREHDPLTRDQRTFARRLATVTQSLSIENGRAPSEDELAGALGLTVLALHDALSRMNATAARSNAATLDEDTAEHATEDGDRPDFACERRERQRRLLAAMDQLPERMLGVMRMYYDEGRTLRQIATTMGVTESRVSQIHGDAIARLRGLVAEH